MSDDEVARIREELRWEQQMALLQNAGLQQQMALLQRGQQFNPLMQHQYDAARYMQGGIAKPNQFKEGPHTNWTEGPDKRLLLLKKG